jgi:hypothetical protein
MTTHTAQATIDTLTARTLKNAGGVNKKTDAGLVAFYWDDQDEHCFVVQALHIGVGGGWCQPTYEGDDFAAALATFQAAR